MPDIRALEIEVIKCRAMCLAFVELLKIVKDANGEAILSADRYVTFDRLYTEKLALLQAERIDAS